MDTVSKLAILADAAKYDASCASSGAYRKRDAKGIGNSTGVGICHSYTPDGRCVSLLKILLTNFCIYDCQFCINRISSDTPRARFTPREVVTLTLDFYKRNYIEGLFLSSGIIQSADYTMEQIVAVARSLRTEHYFNGYIHLKVIAGASETLLAEAGRYADRVSVNIELARQSDLDLLAPAKKHTTIENSMSAVREKIDEAKSAKTSKKTDAPKFSAAGQSTQLIVGATPASDNEILSKASDLYKRQKLRRVYYSAYSPIPHSAASLPHAKPPLVREHRLYQADWLARFYGFSINELFTAEEQNLSLEIDPKLRWALQHKDLFPIDINRADRNLLLRVPGFGVRTVERIIQARRFFPLRIADVARLRVPLSRAKFFIETADKNAAVHKLDQQTVASFTTKPMVQLSIFEVPESALTGEL